jgi:hypothetical protein
MKYEIISSNYFNIKSIKRTSDGKIFSTGEFIFAEKELCEILLIHQHNYLTYNGLSIICVTKRKKYTRKKYFNMKINEIDKVLSVL